MVFLADADEEADCWKVVLQKDFKFSDYVHGLCSGDFAKGLLLL